ncbi:MAG: PAS domain S-box protein [Thermodesulfobacteriota bacterium]
MLPEKTCFIKTCVFLYCLYIFFFISWPAKTFATDNINNKATDVSAFSKDFKKTVTFGVYQNKPKIYTDKHNKPAGIFVDIIKKTAEKENWNLNFIRCNWSECIKMTKSGKIDIMPDMAVSPEREKYFDFNEEVVLESWTRIYSGGNLSGETFSALKNKKIAVLKDSIQKNMLEQIMKGLEFEYEILEAETFDKAFQLAANKTADAAAANHFFGNYYYSDYGLEKTAIIFNPSKLYFATAKNKNSDILKAIDTHLYKMKNSPGSIYYKTLSELMAKPGQTKLPEYFIIIITSATVFLVSAFIIIFIMKIKLKSKSKNLTSTINTLEISEKNFRNLFNSMSQGVVYQNHKGDIIYSNPAAEKILGISLTSLKKNKDQNPLLEPLDEQGNRFDYKDIPYIKALELEHEIKDQIIGIKNKSEQETRWLIINSLPDFTENSESSHQVYSIFTDITEIKKIEEKLSNKNLELELVFKTIPDAIVYADLSRRIVKVNPAFVKTFGYQEEEVKGKSTTLLYASEEDYEKLGKTIYNKNANLTGIPFEVEYKKADNSIFTGETSGTHITDNSGKVIGMFAMIRDITEKRKLEQDLQQSQRIDSIGRLAGGIAHDFNNLLSIILGYGEMLMNKSQNNKDFYEPLDQIVQAGLKARNLTRQLLAFSRKQVMKISPVDVNKIIYGFEKLLKRIINAQIEIKFDLCPEPCIINADAVRIEQVIMNLVVNSRDAMPDGGIIIIRTEIVRLDGENRKINLDKGQYVKISISDSGSGIEKDTMENIFEPFFTTKERDKGTGLGLSTSYGIIKQHKGNIFCYSDPGKGTTFNIYLPLTNDKYKNLSEHNDKNKEFEGSETILIAEDSNEVKEIACQILKQQGYTIFSAQSGEDALKLIKENSLKPDLLLADVIMPGINGKELFQEIKKIIPSVKILYMSGYTDDLIIKKGIFEDKVNFIHKPFSFRTLSETVRNVLDEDN